MLANVRRHVLDMLTAAARGGAESVGTAVAATVGLGPVGFVAGWAAKKVTAKVATSILKCLRKLPEPEQVVVLEATANLTREERQQLAAEAAQAASAGLPAEDQQRVRQYVECIPVALRASMARDASGRSVVAADCLPRDEQELEQILPPPPPFAVPCDLPGTAYRLTELIGSGGFGVVYKAIIPSEQYGDPRAIKFCLDSARADSLKRESRVLETLRANAERWASSIVRLFGVQLEAQPPFLIYEFMSGGDLSDYAARRHQATGKPLSAEQVDNLVRQMASALAVAHAAGLVHRDLKPQNILLSGQDDRPVLKLADFGLGAVVKPGLSVSLAQRSLRGSGTPMYMCEEQRREAPDPRHDIYSLGVIWYQLLMGDFSRAIAPGFADDLEERGVATEVVALVSQCVGSMRKRPRDGQELLDRLAKNADVLTAPPQAHGGPRSPTEPPPKPAAQGVRPPQRAAERPGASKLGDIWTSSIGMKFAYIPAGEFLMGDAPQRRVRITKPFMMGIYPVTQAQWRAVMGSDPSLFKGDQLPVEQVSWDDAVAFCKKLSEKEGKKYRLPTEAEWEYACRAGTTTEYYSGDGLAALKKVGWCSYDGQFGSAKSTKPVGSFQPNSWGLFDMHGNVWEWCSDWYAEYPTANATDPTGPAEGTSRVLRGGSWGHIPRSCRAAFRGSYAPGYRYYYFGFRVALDFH